MYCIYVADVETTNLDSRLGDIIELSLLRLSDNQQRTFYFQPVNWDNIEEAALRINGHKLEDMKRGFRLEEDGSKTLYKKPVDALVDVEEFLLEDCVTAAERVLAGQNINFDIDYLRALWASLGQKETYPFGRRYLDTMQIAFVLDHVNGIEREGYSLSQLVKAYDVKKEKAHRSDADVRMTRDVLLKLFEAMKDQTLIKRS